MTPPDEPPVESPRPAAGSDYTIKFPISPVGPGPAKSDRFAEALELLEDAERDLAIVAAVDGGIGAVIQSGPEGLKVTTNSRPSPDLTPEEVIEVRKAIRRITIDVVAALDYAAVEIVDRTHPALSESERQELLEKVCYPRPEPGTSDTTAFERAKRKFSWLKPETRRGAEMLGFLSGVGPIGAGLVRTLVPIYEIRREGAHRAIPQLQPAESSIEASVGGNMLPIAKVRTIVMRDGKTRPGPALGIAITHVRGAIESAKYTLEYEDWSERRQAMVGELIRNHGHSREPLSIPVPGPDMPEHPAVKRHREERAASKEKPGDGGI